MSASAPDTPERAPRRNSAVLAALTSLTWVAAVVAAFGFISLLSGLEVISDRSAGPLLGPVSVAAAATVLFLRLRRCARTLAGWGFAAVFAALDTYVVLLLVGPLFLLVANGADAFVNYLAANALSPFVLSACTLAALAGASFVGLNSYREGGGQRPRWPWEDPFDV